jgi:hypothetical protein
MYDMYCFVLFADGYPIATKTSHRIEQRGLSQPDVILNVRGKSEGYKNSRFGAVSVN